MANHLTRESKTELAKIQNQPLDPLNHEVVDAAAGFKGAKKDSPLEIRSEDNLIRAAKRYATLQRRAIRRAEKAGKDKRIASIEELLKRGGFLRQRLIEFSKKINAYQPRRVFFAVDEMADPEIAALLKVLIQPQTLEAAFKIHSREAPPKFHSGYDVVFVGQRKQSDASSTPALVPPTAV